MTKTYDIEETTYLLEDNRKNNEIYDKYKLVYWIYFIFGIAMLLPWNVFITASEYFAKKFIHTPYEATFQNYFSTYFTVTNLIMYMFLLYIQNKSTFRVNPFIPMVFNMIIFGILAITVKVNVAEGSSYFLFIMTLIILTGITSSLFQNAIFSEAGQLPPIYMQAVLGGQGIAGVIVAISSISSTMIGSNADINQSAFLYFLSAFLITIVSFIGRMIIYRLPYYRYITSQNNSSTKLIEDIPRESIDILKILYRLKGYIFSVNFDFLITIMIFPSITSLVKSSNTMSNELFVGLHFLLFNVGDWIGRTLPLMESFKTVNITRIVLFALLRTLFIPVFLLCNIIILEERNLPTLIQNDMIYFALILVFSISCGWLCSLCMMLAPQSSEDPKEKSMIGIIMSFTLIAGLAMGGSLSFLIRWIV